jgi:hypothetical protein
MFFIMAVVRSFERHLLESISHCWIYSHRIPFVAWVLCVLFVQFVRMSL